MNDHTRQAPHPADGRPPTRRVPTAASRPCRRHPNAGLQAHRPQHIKEPTGSRKGTDMRLTFFRGIALGAVTSTLALGTTAALAGTGPGANFNLGKINTVNATSTLTGSATGSLLKI